MYDLKGSKKRCPRLRTGQFSRTWKVRGQGLDSPRPRPRPSISKTVLEAKDVLQAATSSLQEMRPEVHAPTCLPFCASARDHPKILKHSAKGVGTKMSRGANGKNKTKK